MFEIALFGAGKIGQAICALLVPSGRYRIRIADNNLAQAKSVAAKWASHCSAHALNVDDTKGVLKLLEGCSAVVSALPFFCNVAVARAAREANVHYFDLTEDVETTQAISTLAKGASTVFMPQCGLAPGFISIAAADLITRMDVVEQVKMRVGALPIYPSNRLKYNLTWSTEGLINEYGNLCEVVINGQKQNVLPLEGYERFLLDGVEYEAFNTSGGLGTLCDTYGDRVKILNYKSVRYPGHREIIQFLMQDLQFNDHRDLLKTIFERSIPTTKQDKCIIFVEAKGMLQGRYTQLTYASTVYNQHVHGTHLGAIQVTTASGVCAPLDIILTGQHGTKDGFVTCESIPLAQFLKNEFGGYYRDERALDALKI